MGRLIATARLAWRGLRRDPLRSTILLLAVTTTCAAVALGLTLSDSAGQSYARTRAATDGPDVVAMSRDTGDTARHDLAPLLELPGVVDHVGPFPVAFTTLRAHGLTADAVVEGRDPTPDAIDHPRLTEGGWVRPGGAVVEHAFALALGVETGDRLTVAGHTFTVTGIALTAATSPYPGAGWSPPGGGPSPNAGLVWLTQDDVHDLASPELPLAYTAKLRLADPGNAEAFVADTEAQHARSNVRTWQDLAHATDRRLRPLHEAITIGSGLLIVLALAGASGLVAGRMAEQNRWIGLFRAVGATPALVAAALLAEYLALALVAGAAGLALACLVAPALSDPGGGLLDTALATPSVSTVVTVSVTALTLSTGAALGPALRAARTTTAHALADPARPPRRHPALAPAAWLPVPLMLGLRLAARHPRRALVSAVGAFTAATGLAAALTFSVQPRFGIDLQGSTLPNPREVLTDHLVTGVIVAVVVLAAVNALAAAWHAALDARRPLAITRTLGATPGQATLGFVIAQLLPAVPTVLIGVPAGTGLIALLHLGPAPVVEPSSAQTTLLVAGTLLALTALASVPARLSARHPVHEALRGGPR